MRTGCPLSISETMAGRYAFLCTCHCILGCIGRVSFYFLFLAHHVVYYHDDDDDGGFSPGDRHHGSTESAGSQGVQPAGLHSGSHRRSTATTDDSQHSNRNVDVAAGDDGATGTVAPSNVDTLTYILAADYTRDATSECSCAEFRAFAGTCSQLRFIPRKLCTRESLYCCSFHPMYSLAGIELAGEPELGFPAERKGVCHSEDGVCLYVIKRNCFSNGSGKGQCSSSRRSGF